MALRWSVRELAEKSKVSSSTIKRVEAADGDLSSTQVNTFALVKTLEAEGIEFIGKPKDRPGIRVGKPSQQV